MDRVATPLPFSTPVPIEAAASKNVTVPVGVPPAVLLTVAVNVTGWPVMEGFTEETSEVALGLSTICVMELDVLVAKLVSPP